MAIEIYVDRGVDMNLSLIELVKSLFVDVQSMQESILKTLVSLIFTSKRVHTIDIQDIFNIESSIAIKYNWVIDTSDQCLETTKSIRKALAAITLFESFMSSRSDVANSLLACVTDRLLPNGKNCLIFPHPIILNRWVLITCHSWPSKQVSHECMS